MPGAAAFFSRSSMTVGHLANKAAGRKRPWESSRTPVGRSRGRGHEAAGGGAVVLTCGVVNYKLNHSRYIGSRRVRLSANEKKLIARAAKRSKAKRKSGKGKALSPEEKAAQQSRFFKDAQRIAAQVAEARAGGDADRVLELYGQAKGKLFLAFGKKVAQGMQQSDSSPASYPPLQSELSSESCSGLHLGLLLGFNMAIIGPGWHIW